VTIAKRPSCERGTAEASKDVLPDGESGKFLIGGLESRAKQRGDFLVGQNRLELPVRNSMDAGGIVIREFLSAWQRREKGSFD